MMEQESETLDRKKEAEMMFACDCAAAAEKSSPPVSWQPKSPYGSCLLSSTNAPTMTFEPHS